MLSIFLFILTTLTSSLDVFTHGQEGYSCYRIPSLYLTSNKTLIAFAEARKYSCGDHGYVDLVYKLSYDYGNTWSKLNILYSDSKSQTDYNTIGNPSPVQSSVNGVLYMLFCKNNKEIYISSSSNNGETFSSPTILSSVNDNNWNWVATGPPGGIEISYNNAKRLVVPLDWSVPGMFSTKGYVIYSDDNGKTWKRSQYFGTNQYWPNESQGVQLSNGSLMINSRTGKNDSSLRLKSISNDGGVTWDYTAYIKDLTDTSGGCEGSMVKSGLNGNLYYTGVTPYKVSNNRANLTLSVSSDDGGSWKVVKIVQSGSAAYSSLATIDETKEVAVLYERDSYGYLTLEKYPQVV